ncbi:MAG TPA: hypothetical protein VIS55_01250 [Pseudomonadales bacterium]|jgi:N-acyl-D-aspartate/D-glutamate deacylase
MANGVIRILALWLIASAVQAAEDFTLELSGGRVMDADITVFDPLTVEDQATYQNPYQPSAGIRHVIVNGVFVVRDEQFVENTFPGRRISSSL